MMSSKTVSSLSITSNIKQISRKFAAVKKRIKSNDIIRNKKASIYLDKWVQENFKTSGKKVGGWKPLDAGGRWKKGKFDASAKVLIDTSQLRRSFHPFANRKTAGIKSELEYAEKHHKGKGNLPERRLLPYKKEVKKDLKKIYENDIAQEARRFNTL